jgi:hypothetical protein
LAALQLISTRYNCKQDARSACSGKSCYARIFRYLIKQLRCIAGTAHTPYGRKEYEISDFMLDACTGWIHAG